jgi:hypothetical protein
VFIFFYAKAEFPRAISTSDRAFPCAIQIQNGQVGHNEMLQNLIMLHLKKDKVSNLNARDHKIARVNAA